MNSEISSALDTLFLITDFNSSCFPTKYLAHWAPNCKYLPFKSTLTEYFLGHKRNFPPPLFNLSEILISKFNIPDVSLLFKKKSDITVCNFACNFAISPGDSRALL